MANPYVPPGTWAADRGYNVGGATNLDNFYGYGSDFVSDAQFVLDMKENIHLFGADATPFFSWMSMVRKNPTHGIDFSWMEDELFLQRDIKATLKRTANTGNAFFTLQMLQGGDWQAFEGAPLADAITQAAATTVPAAPVIYMQLETRNTSNAVVGRLLLIPTAYGLSVGPNKRTVTDVGGTARTLINELIIADDTAGTVNNGTLLGVGQSCAGGQNNNYLREIFPYWNTTSNNGTATTAMKTITQAVLHALFTASIATMSTYVSVVTPNEHLKGYAQGSGLPNESRKRIRSFKNYVQIFKTPYSISNTLQAVKLYGGEELAKLRYRKAIQHKVDIERAILFQGGGTEGTAWGVIGTETYENPLTRFKGLGVGKTTAATAGFIVTKNADIDSAFQFAYASATMSTLNTLASRIFEDTVDTPSSSKIVFASRKWRGALAEMAFKQEVGYSGGTSGGSYRWGNIGQKDGRLGVKVSTLETPYGDLHFVDMPHFRGIYEDYALVVDFNHLEVRPLRDTFLKANCGDGTVDGQIDYYLTELGFECRHESAHAILKLV